MNDSRQKLAALRAAHRAGWLTLRGVLPRDGSADGIAETLEKVADKLFDDLDAVYAFFAEPEPQSIKAPEEGERHLRVVS